MSGTTFDGRGGDTRVRPSTFLIGRGVERGYATLLAPSDLSPIDTQAISGLLKTSDSPQRIEVALPDLGRVTITYCTEPVTADQLGQLDSPLDRHGRPLQITYGTIDRPGATTQATGQLARARDEGLTTYRHFLKHEERWPGPARSAPLVDPPGPDLMPEPLHRAAPEVLPPVPDIGQRRRDLLVGICIGVVVGAAVAAVVFYVLTRTVWAGEPAVSTDPAVSTAIPPGAIQN